MQHWTRVGIACLVLFCPAAFAQPGETSSLPQVLANAGVVRDSALIVQLLASQQRPYAGL